MTDKDKPCYFCEGSKKHQGDTCGACSGKGNELTRKANQRLHNAMNDLPKNYNVNPEKDY